MAQAKRLVLEAEFRLASLKQVLKKKQAGLALLQTRREQKQMDEFAALQTRRTGSRAFQWKSIMSVESSSTASSPKTLAGRKQQCQGQRQSEVGERPDDVPGGFLALITALDSDTDVSAEVQRGDDQPRHADPALLLAQDCKCRPVGTWPVGVAGAVSLARLRWPAVGAGVVSVVPLVSVR